MVTRKQDSIRLLYGDLDILVKHRGEAIRLSGHTGQSCPGDYLQ